MTQLDKLSRLKEFKNESDFRFFLISLLKKIGFKDVLHTHRYGSPELGKDIIARLDHSLEGSEWYSFVVKFGRISGGTVEVETVKGQISQSFEYPYVGIDGKELKISRVKVVTNENFTQGAQQTISTSSKLRLYNNFGFWWNENLIDLIDKHYPEFWLPGNNFLKSYSKELKKNIREEFELKELSMRKIEDKNIKKLIDIFVDPVVTEINLEDNEDKEKGKTYNRKRISINTILNSDDNFIVVGEAGCGKTKIVNNIIADFLESKQFLEDKNLPIKLKAKNLREFEFDIENAIFEYIKHLTQDDFVSDLSSYTFHIFIDEIDLLFKDERDKLINNLNIYCEAKHRFIITKRRNYNIEIEEAEKNSRTLRIHNFNINQVKSFIEKFFDGERGLKFVAILKESNILQKLPTTPLTITLLSLLYDENNYEIPATLTDIYDDFSNILLGKLEVRSRTDLLVYNIKRRLFTIIALDMLVNKKADITYSEFEEKVNDFLKSRGYMLQNRDELLTIIENCGILYIDENERVGFKQRAFVEYLSSIEIYDHSRSEYYESLLSKFNDLSWQNTAIFFAGRSKDLPNMIEDLLEKMPNKTVNDWFINTGGMGYLSQALYQTEPKERKKLVVRGVENLSQSFEQMKSDSKSVNGFLKDIPMPLLATILVHWFVENFKSITLKQTLIDAFNELEIKYSDAKINDFYGDFKLFMIAAALMNKNIGFEDKFIELMTRDSFIKNPVLMIAGDMYLEHGEIQKSSVDKVKGKFDKVIKQYINVVKYLVKEPAHRINDEYRLLPTES